MTDHLTPKAPRVAVLLATYNGGRYIAEFLDSLLAQTLLPACVYVRDDGSRDDTLAIVARYQGRLAINVLPAGPRLGPGLSFMTLLQAASPDYDLFAFADQDDRWLAPKLARASAALARAIAA